MSAKESSTASDVEVLYTDVPTTVTTTHSKTDCSKEGLDFCSEGKYWATPHADRSGCPTTDLDSASPMQQRIVVKNNYADKDHINKRVGHFVGADVYFGTVVGVREVSGESLWEIHLIIT